jgi:hypothetical protein
MSDIEDIHQRNERMKKHREHYNPTATMIIGIIGLLTTILAYWLAIYGVYKLFFY